MMNNQANHTPGPWIAAGSYIVAQRNPGGIKNHIAEVSRDVGSSVCLANARLIAAAPELLEALKDARSFLNSGIGRSQLLIEQCDRAITKATGETKI